MTNEEIAETKRLLDKGIQPIPFTVRAMLEALESSRTELAAETRALERAAEYGANNSPLEKINKEFLLNYFREVPHD